MTETKAEYRVKVVAAEEEKPWRCETCGNLLGYIVRNNGLHELHVIVDVLDRRYWPVMVGDGRVACETCDHVNEWFWGRDAMEKMLERRSSCK